MKSTSLPLIDQAGQEGKNVVRLRAATIYVLDGAAARGEAHDRVREVIQDPPPVIGGLAYAGLFPLPTEALCLFLSAVGYRASEIPKEV